jgi:hypothetical protein
MGQVRKTFHYFVGLSTILFFAGDSDFAGPSTVNE